MEEICRWRRRAVGLLLYVDVSTLRVTHIAEIHYMSVSSRSYVVWLCHILRMMTASFANVAGDYHCQIDFLLVKWCKYFLAENLVER